MTEEDKKCWEKMRALMKPPLLPAMTTDEADDWPPKGQTRFLVEFSAFGGRLFSQIEEREFPEGWPPKEYYLPRTVRAKPWDGSLHLAPPSPVEPVTFRLMEIVPIDHPLKYVFCYHME